MKQVFPAIASIMILATPGFAALSDADMDTTLASVRAGCAQGGAEETCMAALRVAIDAIVAARTAGNEAATDAQLAEVIAEITRMSAEGMSPELAAAIGSVIVNEVSPEMQDRSAAAAMDVAALDIASGNTAGSQGSVGAISVSAN